MKLSSFCNLGIEMVSRCPLYENHVAPGSLQGLDCFEESQRDMCEELGT